MFLFKKFLLSICWLFICFAEWLRSWPQGSNSTVPYGYLLGYMPADILPPKDAPAKFGRWSQLEALGLICLGDDWKCRYLRPVACPPGWTSIKEGGCEYIRDKDGRLLAIIRFDRPLEAKDPDSPCFIRLMTRFYVDEHYIGDYEVVGRVIDRDNDDEVVSTTPVFKRGYTIDHRTAADTVTAQARHWLDENHPAWHCACYGRNETGAVREVAV